MKWLVTGGAGFIGSNFIRLLLRERPDAEVVNLDLLTYAGNLENLRDVDGDPRYRFVRGDVVTPEAWSGQLPFEPEVVAHFAAESHVDRSIEDAHPFLRTNVIGTQSMLEWARRAKVRRFLQVGTDEVYGTLAPDDKAFSETSPIRPNSAYSASKAAADLLVRAMWKTHGLEVVTTRCSNNYGPFQFPEKFLPLLISNAVDDKDIPVYGDGMQVRDWIHVDDHSRGVLAVMERGRPGQVYNLGGDGERPNLHMARTILSILGKPESLLKHVVDRKGHDRRYAIDFTLAETELGWRPTVPLEEGLRATVQWYLDHGDWLAGVRSGSYREYYETMYGDRLRSAGGARRDPA